MLDRHAFSIVVPVYNNAATLKALTEKISESLQQLTADFEIIFVDDGSHDDSKAVLKTLNDRSGKLSTIELEKNVGQWEATLLGIAKARGRYVVTIDADLQYDPADILRLYQHLRQNGFLLVYGIPARMVHGLGGLRNRIMNFVLRKKTTSSFKVFHRDIVFDEQNHFFCKRHFECHEKLHVSPSKKGWLEVNDKQKAGGGFRRHVSRNINIMLTYLPEYDLHFRHPIALIGGTIITLSVLLFGVILLFTDIPLKELIPLGILLITGMLLFVIGARWKLKYNRVVAMRKKLLLAIGA